MLTYNVFYHAICQVDSFIRLYLSDTYFQITIFSALRKVLRFAFKKKYMSNKHSLHDGINAKSVQQT